ncbi:hypothetical protein SKP52_24010 (plasmid) [Sphingopyxis fribergensis]|uniref:Uncharacterized protein n=1 Tax=Sphingopyxis fribergensis TaxID=1515612 RepID=A0A0A7PNS5_9SPHN|nr:hypothetical protein SKP52_24010 [Sphingopyxis fribergensis]
MRATDRHPPIGNLLYSLGPRFCDRDQARRAPAGLGPSGNDQGHGKMVGRLLAPAVVFEASPRYSRAEAPGCAQTCPAPFYAAFQAPGVASGGARGRALRALKQKTGPAGLRFPPLRGGASVFQLAPRYPPSASWGLRRRLRRGWTGEGIASLPPTIAEPALVGPGDLRCPRSRASVCCSGSPKRIAISSRKQ